MSWQIRIAALLAVLLGLAAAGWRIHVKADAAGYSRALAEQTQAALAASEKRRLDERALSIANQGITNEYIAEKNRRAAVDADTAERLRDYQAALADSTRADASAGSSIAGTLATIASECARELAALDEHAGRLAAIAAALQNYAAKVRLKE